MHTQLPEANPHYKRRSRLYYLKVVLLAAFIASTLFISGCAFEEPVLPEWTVSVNVPLENETFILGEEIVNDSTIITQGGDSSIYISINGDLEAMEIDISDFDLPSTTINQSFVVGAIQLENLDALRSPVVTLGELLPSLEEAVVLADTVPITFPDTTLQPEAQQLNSQQFRALHVVDGQIAIGFENNLPLAVGPNSSHPGGMEVALYDSLNTRIAVFNFTEVINPGESDVRVSSFGDSDTWIYTPLRIEYLLPFAEETTVEMTEQMLDETGVTISVSLTSLEVDDAIALIDPQEFDRDVAFKLNTDDQLSEAVIERGRVHMVFTNTTELAAAIDFTLPEFQDAQSNPFSSSVTLPGGSTTELDFNLAAWQIRSANVGQYVDSIRVEYSARTLAAGSMVQLSADDSIVVDIEIDPLTLQSFSGLMAEESFAIDPVQEDDLINYEDIPDNIKLSDVNLELTIANEVNIEDLFVNFYITGYHEDDNGVVTDSATLNVTNERINPGSSVNPGVTVISLSGDNVADFLNILPNSIRTWGDVRASGEASMSGSRQITSSYAFSTPLKFRIDGDASIRGDVEVLTEEDIDEDLQDAAEENIEAGQLRVYLDNHVPIGGTVRLIVSADPSNTDIFDLENANSDLGFVKEISVQAAPADPGTGFVTEGLQNSIDLTLTKEEIRLFQNPPLQFGYELVVDGTGTNVVAIRSTDYVRIGGVATITVLIKE